MSEEALAYRRLHPGSVVLRFLKEAPSTVLALPAGLAFVSQSGLWRALYWAALLGLVLLLINLLSWWRFRYGVGAGEIVIESGVLSRNRRSIPFGRIQDVDLERSFLARLFGLAKVRIETGAGGKDEGLLDSVSMAEAQRLRDAVRAARSENLLAPTEEAATPATPLLFAMDLPRVLLFGLFNFSLVYLAGLFAFLQAFENFLPFDIYDPARWMGLAEEYLPARFSAAAIAAILVLAILLGIVAGVLRTLSRDYGFSLRLEGERFRRERGLLTRSEVVIARRRIQLAQLTTGPVRRAFGWSGLSFQTLGAGTDRSGHQSAAPFATRSEVEAVLREAGPLRLPPPPELEPVSKRHIVRALGTSLFPALTAILLLSIWARPALMLLALLPLLGVWAALERRFHRFALDGDLLLVARGVWRQRLWIVPLKNVQAISLSRGFLQRRLGLASVALDTAGAPLLNVPRVIDLREAAAEALAAEIALRRLLHSGRKSGTER
ncbi:MAG TPA: PH domain-containing protein [Allosphingosinicella sp.]